MSVVKLRPGRAPRLILGQAEGVGDRVSAKDKSWCPATPYVGVCGHTTTHHDAALIQAAGVEFERGKDRFFWLHDLRPEPSPRDEVTLRFSVCLSCPLEIRVWNARRLDARILAATRSRRATPGPLAETVMRAGFDGVVVRFHGLKHHWVLATRDAGLAPVSDDDEDVPFGDRAGS